MLLESGLYAGCLWSDWKPCSLPSDDTEKSEVHCLVRRILFQLVFLHFSLFDSQVFILSGVYSVRWKEAKRGRRGVKFEGRLQPLPYRGANSDLNFVEYNQNIYGPFVFELWLTSPIVLHCSWHLLIKLVHSMYYSSDLIVSERISHVFHIIEPFDKWIRWLTPLDSEPIGATPGLPHQSVQVLIKNGFLPERVFLFYCNQQGYQENKNLVEPLFLSSPTGVVTWYYCFRNMVTTNGRILKRVHCNHICGISLIATTLACSSGNSILFAVW